MSLIERVRAYYRNNPHEAQMVRTVLVISTGASLLSLAMGTGMNRLISHSKAPVEPKPTTMPSGARPTEVPMVTVSTPVMERLRFRGNSVPVTPDSSDQTKWRIMACTEGFGGLNITMRVDVNTANDGSDKGNWERLKELGVPCFNQNDAPELYPDRYPSGNYLIRAQAHRNEVPWEGDPRDPNSQNKIAEQRSIIRICDTGGRRTVC